MKAMLAAAVLLYGTAVRRVRGESIGAPDWVVSVSLMCGMVACWGGGWQAINNTLHISGRNMRFIQSSQIVGLLSQSCFRCMERGRQPV